METFKDFFSELKDRSSNPLIASFVIAWLIFNWPIPIGVLLYKPADLQADGYRSYYQLIKSNYSNCKMILYPGLTSLFYTFLFPYIKAGVKLYNAKIESKNESDILIASKDGKMPVMKYIKLRDENKGVIDRLNTLIDSESALESEVVKLKADIIALNKDNAKKEEDRVSLATYITQLEKSTKSILNGTWAVVIEFINGTQSETTWEISDDIIRDKDRNTYILTDQIFNPFTRELVLRMVAETEKQEASIHFLLVNDDLTILRSRSGQREYPKLHLRKIKPD